MPVHLHTQGSATNVDEKPRSDAISWFDLARVVYTWTDGREFTIDRAWWKTAGAYYRTLRGRTPQAEEAIPVAPPELELVETTLDLNPAVATAPRHRIPPWATAEQKHGL